MLTNTFIHLPGVGAATERSLWRQGCADWDCYLAPDSRYSVGSASRELVRKELHRSKQSLIEGRHQYFRKKLRARHAWRAFDAFRNSCVYLDIETDGTAGEESVTCIGLYDGKDYVCLLKGEDIESFRDRVSHYSMIISFFGTGFDLPVLEKRFPGLMLDQIHFDLCPALRDLGYTGGLKRIEQKLSIERSSETAGLTGYDAVKLWRAAQRGSDSALRLLVEYNREDTVNLERLAEITFAKLKDETVGRGARTPSLDFG